MPAFEVARMFSHQFRNRRLLQLSVLVAGAAMWLALAAQGRERAAVAEAESNPGEAYSLPFGPNPFSPGAVRTTTGDFIEVDKFIPAAYCGRCHTDAHAQWEQSAHRNSFREPFYKKNVELFIDQYGLEVTRHCESCHNPVALVSGALTPGAVTPRPFDEEGITCTVCHSIERITNLEGIGSYELRPPALLLHPDGTPFEGAISDRMILDNVEAHRRAMMKDFYKTPEFCATCHKSALPREIENYKWRRAFSTYDEWQMSSHSNESPLPFYQKPRSTCQSCHMPPETAKTDAAARQGKIASHRWPGANTAIPFFYGFDDQLKATIDFLEAGRLEIDIFALWKGPAYPTQREATDLVMLRKGVVPTNLLSGFTTIGMVDAPLFPGYLKSDASMIAPIDKSSFLLQAGETITIGVVVSNPGVGHFFPTELRDFYEPWVEFKVQDATGQTVYHSGFVKENGEVDERAHIFQSVQVTEQGEWVRHHNIWSTRGRAYDNYIQPGRSELIRYQFTIPPYAAGPLRISARVLYRRFNRFYSNWVLGQSVDYPIVEMARSGITLNIGKNRPRAAHLDRRDLIRFNNLGIAFLDQLMFANARRAFLETTRIDPEYDQGYVNQAIATFWGDFDVMHKLLDQALSINPDNARALYYKGVILRMANRPSAALEFFRRIEPRYPRDRMILNQMGLCYQALGEPARAREMFERVLVIDPDDITALFFIMKAYFDIGEAAQAFRGRKIYLDRFEDWRIHYLANEYTKKDDAARAEAVPWHIHADEDVKAGHKADPLYWGTEGVPRKKAR